MVVGESGLGKSTLINSMFLTDIYQAPSSEHPKSAQTLNIKAQKVQFVENDVHLTLTVVDTPGAYPPKFHIQYGGVTKYNIELPSPQT